MNERRFARCWKATLEGALAALLLSGCETLLPPPPQDLDGDGWYGVGGTDCDDSDPAVRPEPLEVESRCDGRDDDCDGVLDEGFDVDGDGARSAALCPPGNGTDCNDGDASIGPHVAEACEGSTDEDCDGLIDEGFDQDGDGSRSAVSCLNGAGTDCDDHDAAIYPGAPEGGINDDVDSNCNGATGEFERIAGADWSLEANDGKPALQSLFYLPLDVAADSAGSLYVSTTDRLVWKVTAAGVAQVLIGPDSSASGVDLATWTPAGLWVEEGEPHGPEGSVVLYIADRVGRLLRYRDGNIDVLTDDLNGPLDVTGGPSGSLYVADSAGGTVVEMMTDGTFTPYAELPGPVDDSFYPFSVVTDTEERLYISDMGGRRLYRDNSLIASSDDDCWFQPGGLAWDPAGDALFVADFASSVVLRFGALDREGGGCGETFLTQDEGYDGHPDGWLVRPGGLATPADGRYAGSLLVTDYYSGWIRAVDLDSDDVSHVAGALPYGDAAAGTPALDAPVHEPAAIAFSPVGEMHFVDFFNEKVKRIDESGLMRDVTDPAVFVSGCATPQRVVGITDIAFSPDGSLFIASPGSAAVFARAPGGQVTCVLGESELETLLAGPPSQRFAPSGLAWDAARAALLISDGDNGLLMRVPAGGSGMLELSAAELLLLNGASTGSLCEEPDAEHTTVSEPYEGAVHLMDVVSTVGTGTSDDAIYLADADNRHIFRYYCDGTLTPIAGSTVEGPPLSIGGEYRALEVNLTPVALSADAGGSLYVADVVYGRVLRLTLELDGSYTAVPLVGTGGGGHGSLEGRDKQSLDELELFSPKGVAASADGSQVVVSDTGNHRILRVLF